MVIYISDYIHKCLHTVTIATKRIKIWSQFKLFRLTYNPAKNKIALKEKASKNAFENTIAQI